MGRYTEGSGDPGSTLVPVLWYESIKRWQSKSNEPMPSLFFHKVTTLSRFRLEQKGLRVPLPYAWYLFGTAAEELPHSVQFFSDVQSDHTSVTWQGPSPELYEGDRTADAIRSTIDEILTDYPHARAERAVDEVYAHAPFEFQRKYRRVRIACHLTGVGSAEQDTINTVGGIWGLLAEALDDFPYENFPRLARDVGVVKETVKVCLTANLERRQALAVEVVEGFWRTFCESLRVDNEGHRNVGTATIQHWRRLAERSLQFFDRCLGDIAVEVADWDNSIEQDATLGPVVERRRAEQLIEERLVDDGLSALKEAGGAGSLY
jgi:hypothetical protein